MGKKAQRASQLFQVGPKWKRELVPDHKFDFIDVTEFRSHNCLYHIRYFIMYICILLSVAAYCADIWSAIILLVYNKWSLSKEPKIPMYISKWIYVACIALSFIFLAWDIRKARIVMASRDISYSVTNNIVYRYKSVKSYNVFCLFVKIGRSKRFSDSIAFYVFFTLKSWKSLLFAQGPRQIIAGFTVAAILETAWKKQKEANALHFITNWDIYGEDWQQRVALLLMAFTCLYWIFCMLNLLLALILYIPVFCQIQGNLKEYCCHKIDKRISKILEKQRLKRLKEQEKKQNHHHGNNNNNNNKHSNNTHDDASLLATPTLPVMDDMYSDKRPLYHDFYNQHHPSQERINAHHYPMSEPPTPYQHHVMTSPLPPMPQKAYTQPAPYNPQFNHSTHYDDYYDEKSYVSDEPTLNHYQQHQAPYMTPQHQYTSPASYHTSPYVDHHSYAAAGSPARQQQQQYHHQYTT
ncbi:unnamed protein product [Cunninghamella blakesleeana]